MSKEKDTLGINDPPPEAGTFENKNVGKNKSDHLTPEWGVSYEKFVSEKDDRGSASNLAHQLMEGLEENERTAAKNLIQNTLQPADLFSYILKEAETNPEAADAIRKEIVKRLRAKGRTEE
jgi:hypothetical protein